MRTPEGNGVGPTRPPDRTIQRRLLLFTIFIALLLTGGLAIVLLGTREHKLADTRANMHNLTLSMAYQTAQSMRAVDLVLTNLAEDLSALNVDLWDSFAVHQRLKNSIAGLPDIRALVLVSADGWMVNYSPQFPAPRLDLRDREYFQRLRDHPDSGLNLGRPFQNRVNGLWTIDLTRSIPDADGLFRGVILASVDPEYLARQYSSIAPSPDTSFALFRSDGVLLTRHPLVKEFLGTTIDHASPLFQQGGAALEEVDFSNTSPIDGRIRRYVHRRVPNFPLILGMSVTKEEVLDGWWSDSLKLSAGLLLALGALFFFWGWLARELKRRTQDERRVQASEERFRLLFNSGNDVIFVISFTDGQLGRFIEVNEVASRRLGYTREEFRQLTPWDIGDTPGLTREAAQVEVNKKLREDGQILLERVHRTKAGRLIPVEINARRIEFEGRPTILSVVRDITERRAAERQIAEILDLNRKIIAVSTMGMAVYRASGPCVLANESMAQIVGTDHARVLAQNFRQISSWRKFGLLEAATEALDSGRIVRREFHMISTFNKELWIDCTFTSVVSGGESHLLAIFNDVSDYHRAEEALVAAKAEAEKADRTKGEFLAKMSHEIRTPMNGIIGLTHLALQTNLAPNQKDYLEKIQVSARSLLGIINDILDFSKIESGSMTMREIDFTLHDLVKNLSSLLGYSAQQKGLEFLIHVTGATPENLRGDPLRLEQVLLNLLNNAIKFTEKGEVILRIEPLELKPEKAVIRFSVRDTGIGMTPEEIKQLFVPFSQADASRGRTHDGTGLGLAISARLVEMMGGRILVSSQPGEGSLFSFTLPVSLGTPTAPHAVAPPELAGLEVLVVDDNSISREVLRESLESFGMKVTTVGSGEEALAVFQGSGGSARFRLMLMDWLMPGLDGLETTRRLKDLERAVSPPPVIIMVTAHAREDLPREARETGIEAFLVKPVNRSLLFNTIVDIFGLAPAHKATASPTRVAPQLLGRIAGSRILVVEDNEINQQVAREILERAGVAVAVAGDGFRALDILSEGSWDAVLMDIHMPGLDGMETTRRIRADMNLIGLPIIAMTADALKGEREKCLSAGFSDYVSKPIDVTNLYQVLGRWIHPRFPGGEPEPPTAGPESPVSVAFDTTPMPLSPEPDTPSGFDLGNALFRLGGNRALLTRLLRRMAGDAGPALARVRQALAALDWSGAREAVHALKGSAANLGATDLAVAARDLENAIQNQGSDEANERLARLEEMAEQFLALVATWRDSEPAARPAESSAGSIPDRKILSGLFQEAHARLRANDLDAEAEVQRIKQALPSEVYAPDLTELESAVFNLEFDRAMTLLVVLADKLGLDSPA